jgi:hypothetical protein
VCQLGFSVWSRALTVLSWGFAPESLETTFTQQETLRLPLIVACASTANAPPAKPGVNEATVNERSFELVLVKLVLPEDIASLNPIAGPAGPFAP